MSRIPVPQIVSVLENLVRNLVREETERVLQRVFHSSQSSTQLTEIEQQEQQDRSWGLHFSKKLPSQVFTGNRIESEDGACLEVVIVDACSRNIVTSGCLSSIKIEILAIDSDFKINEEDWTEQEFNESVVREREGKRPLLSGELTTTLKNGVGYFSDVAFTDNSSWIRTRKFRLGAKALQSEFRIREARSEAFVVKDHRGESSKKHYPPSLSDEIWRLKKIAKDGVFHKRLASFGIHTVRDLLRFYNTNPSSLRSMLGGMTSVKICDSIIDHATQCVIDDHNLYMYYSVAERAALLLSSVYQVVGAIFDGNYWPVDRLTGSQELLVENLKQHASKNVEDLTLIGCPLFDPSIPSFLQGGFSELGAQHFDNSFAQLGHGELFESFNTSAMGPFGMEGDRALEISVVQSTPSMQLLAPPLANGPAGARSELYDDRIGLAPAVLSGDDCLAGHLSENGILSFKP